MLRVTDGRVLKDRMSETPALTHVLCDMDDWAADDRNIAIEEDGDYGVFEYFLPGVYTGHYFFLSRGSKAKRIAVDMLNEIFDTYEAEVIRGLTPVHHRGALWMNRQLGFQSYGVVDTIAGPHELFILLKEDFKSKWSDHEIKAS